MCRKYFIIMFISSSFALTFYRFLLPERFEKGHEFLKGIMLLMLNPRKKVTFQPYKFSSTLSFLKGSPSLMLIMELQLITWQVNKPSPMPCEGNTLYSDKSVGRYSKHCDVLTMNSCVARVSRCIQSLDSSHI